MVTKHCKGKEGAPNKITERVMLFGHKDNFGEKHTTKQRSILTATKNDFVREEKIGERCSIREVGSQREEVRG